MSKYISSITCKHGDPTHVSTDGKALFAIIDRQGAGILINVIAERAGGAANKFHMSDLDRENLVKSLVDELQAALNERV